MDPTTFRLIAGASAISYPPVTGTFTAANEQITFQQYGSLSWSFPAVSTVSINQGIGTQPATGSINVGRPFYYYGGSRTYTLTAVNQGGISYFFTASITWNGQCPYIGRASEPECPIYYP